nr:copia protein [Tanacetum cinerariifolium]
MALPEDHLAKFHKMADAKEMWKAIKSRFGGNDESKKKIHGASVSHEDANQKFLRSLPSFWSQVALIMKTKPGLDTLSFDDLYNNLRVFKHDVKGSTASSSSNTQNVAFVSVDNTSSTNDVSTAYSVSSLSVSKSQKKGSALYTNEVIHLFFANQSSAPQLDCDDIEPINDDDLKEMDLKWQVAMISMRIKKFHKRTGIKLQFDTKDTVGYNGNKARDNGRRPAYQDDSKALVTMNGEDIDWSGHVKKDTQNFAMMAYSSSNSGNYMPSGPDVEIDYSKFTYGPKQTSVDESDAKTCENPSSESDSSVETTTSMPDPVDNTPKVVSKPKVWSDAPIIQEYESDSDDDSVIDSHTRKGLGYARKSGFVCGSFSHLTRDCDFHEKRMAKQAALPKSKEKGKGHAWMFDLDYLTNSMNYEPVSLENQANKSAGPKEANRSACTQATDDQSLGDKIDKNEKPVSQVKQIFYEELKKIKRQEKEANDAVRMEATHDTQDANTNRTNLLNVVSVLVSAVGPSRALNDDEPLYPDDPSMPHIEDIFASPSEGIFTNSSYDDEGVVIDFNNLETTFSIQKVWVLVDLPFRKKAIGIKWVYRNKKDERGVVVINKARLVAQGHRQKEGIYYDEVFALVARIKAIRIFLAFGSYMGFIVYQMYVKSAFLYGTIDEEVYVIPSPGFVDLKFPNKVKQKEDGIFISQDKYVAKILKKFDFLSVKTSSTPIETQKPLVKDEEAANVDVHLYRFMIGSLMYLTASRPDIMFAVCISKANQKLGLWYLKVSSFNLEAYSDSDYAGANLDKKSTTGGCQFLGRRLISWQCKKQSIMATSTTEAEYVATVEKFCGFRINY